MDGPLLPRSIRWRLQLGLWVLPDREDDYEQRWTLQAICDRNREIIAQQRQGYSQLLLRFEEEGAENQGEWNAHHDPDEKTGSFEEQTNDRVDDISTHEMDPLTALLQEREAQEQRLHDLDLKYRKDKARRKRGAYQELADSTDRGDTYSSRLTRGMIEKDLLRLQHVHHTCHHQRICFRCPEQEVSFDIAVAERTEILTQMLQVYAKQHAHIGYRQGMHELISYCLMAIEKDMLVHESSQQEPSELLHPEFLSHDAFGIFEAIMHQLGQAYDVKMSTNAESPMEHMAKSVLLYVRDACGEMALYQRLISLNCPPELYCTRWLRLLFSREVQGYNNVLLLWDIFFDLCSKAQCPLTSLSPSRYTRPGVTPPLKLGNFPLMVVLEATAASMILLQRASLLSTDEGNEAEAIHRLMNLLPLKNIIPLTATLLSLMRRIQLKEEKKVLPSPSPLADDARKPSFTFTEMAQCALISADQSFRNIFNNATAAVSAQSDSNTQLLKREMLDLSQQRDSSLSRSTNSLGEVYIGDLARQLNDALAIIRQYLMEKGKMTAPPCKTPEMVLAALDQIDEVRKMLLEASQSPADQSSRTSSI